MERPIGCALLDTHAFLWWLADSDHLSLAAYKADFLDHVSSQRFVELRISVADAELAGSLPSPHRDLFDQMLVAQALGRDLTLVSVDKALDRCGIKLLW